MATTLSALRLRLRTKLLETYALVTPASPLVSAQGTTGATTITYKIVARNATGTSVASQGTTITNANATLSASNFNRLTWVAVPGATTYDVYRTATNGTSPTTLGKITNTASTTFDDDGDAGDAATAPTTNTSGIEAPFWTEQELLDILIDGCKDLWRAIIDLHQGHFTTIDASNVSLAASTSTLTGVPTDCFRVLSIEPRDLSNSATSRNLTFKPRPYKSSHFMAARAQSAFDPTSSGIIWYDILNAGSPVAAPTIQVAPQISSAVNLRLVYVHTLATLTESDNNPIPGESDNALLSWGVMWARSKEREDRSPDPNYILTYGTDKQSLLTALTPRQEQEEEVVEDFFGEYWGV